MKTAIVKRVKAGIDAAGKLTGQSTTHYAADVDKAGVVTKWVKDRAAAVAVGEKHAELIVGHYSGKESIGRISFEDEDGEELLAIDGNAALFPAGPKRPGYFPEAEPLKPFTTEEMIAKVKDAGHVVLGKGVAGLVRIITPEQIEDLIGGKAVEFPASGPDDVGVTIEPKVQEKPKS